MRAHSLTLSVAAVIGAFALFATPAEAGGRKHHKHHNNNWYDGGRNDYGYYQRARYYAPRYHYQRVRFVPARAYYRSPAIQIGFVFGGGNGYGRYR